MGDKPILFNSMIIGREWGNNLSHFWVHPVDGKYDVLGPALKSVNRYTAGNRYNATVTNRSAVPYPTVPISREAALELASETCLIGIVRK